MSYFAPPPTLTQSNTATWRTDPDPQRWKAWLHSPLSCSHSLLHPASPASEGDFLFGAAPLKRGRGKQFWMRLSIHLGTQLTQQTGFPVQLIPASFSYLNSRSTCCSRGHANSPDLTNNNVRTWGTKRGLAHTPSKCSGFNLPQARLLIFHQKRHNSPVIMEGELQSNAWHRQPLPHATRSDLNREPHRCEVWFEFDDFTQVRQSWLWLPHCQEHGSSAVVGHVILRISIWKERPWTLTLWAWSARLRDGNAPVVHVSYPQLRGSATAHLLVGQRRAASFPSPYGDPHSHPGRISLLTNTTRIDSVHMKSGHGGAPINKSRWSTMTADNTPVKQEPGTVTCCRDPLWDEHWCQWYDTAGIGCLVQF